MTKRWSTGARNQWKSTVLGLFLGLGTACSDVERTEAQDCSPGQVSVCSCPGDAGPPSGTRACQPDGNAGVCDCDGDSDDGAETSDGSDGSTGYEPSVCGDGVADPGECDIDPDGHLQACPEDCGLGSSTGSDAGCGECPGGTTCFEGVCVGTGELRVSLSWDFVSDLDLYVLTPGGDEISFIEPNAGGGVLDVDDCVGGDCVDNNTTHVENIFFPVQPQQGEYQVWVNNFDGRRAGPFEIQISGSAQATFTGMLPASPVDSEVFAFEI